MPESFLFLFFAVNFVWLIALSVFTYRAISHYNKLSKGLTNKNLQSLLENLLNNQDRNHKDIEYLKSYCDKIQKAGLFHIQKIGLVRFNPFKDTGGDQSFILSLTDGHNTGVIISALYARSGTRWYAKKIIKGKSQDYELTDEEKMALSMGKSA